MHAAILRLPRPPRETAGAWRTRLRPEHTGHWIPARSGHAAALALWASERRKPDLYESTGIADLRGRGDDPDQKANACDRRRSNREGLLPHVSTRRERDRGTRVVVRDGGLIPTSGPARKDANMGSTSLETLEKRLGELERIIAPYESALVAFSGGVDSSLALAVAARSLPKDQVLAVTSNNETYLPSELDLACDFAASLGVEHLVVNTRELDNPNYASNHKDRCYFCKSTLYSDLARIAGEKGYACVVDGANKDDEGDYRPGRKE